MRRRISKSSLINSLTAIGSSIILTSTPAYSQDCDCKQWKEDIKNQETAYISLMNTFNYFNSYFRAKKRLGELQKLTEEELEDIAMTNKVMPILIGLEREMLNDMRKEYNKRCADN